MIDYRSRSNVPNYLSRPYQRRVLILVAGLFLVVFLMFQVAKPGNWQWLWYFTQPKKQEVDTSAPRLTKPPFVLGQFTSRPDQKPVEPDMNKPFYQRVRPELLRNLKDNSRFLPQEKTALLHLLDILKVTEQATIKAAPSEKVSFLQLWTQSKEYRGRLVTIVGKVHGVRSKTLLRRERVSKKTEADGKEADGKEATDRSVVPYFEVWLQPNGSKNPIAIYCLELPERFPMRMEGLDETVEITGFYFKTWWYEAKEKYLIAPLMIAKTLDWTPAAKHAKEDFNLPLLIGLIAAAAAAALLVVIFARRSSRHKLPDYVQRLAEASNRGRDRPPNVAEVLRNLDQSGRNSTGDDFDAP